MSRDIGNPTSLGELARRQAAGPLPGRARELEHLLRSLRPNGRLITYVHGIGGIGKTTLATTLARRAREEGARVIELDGRSIEPTERGFLRALADAIEAPEVSLDTILARFEMSGDVIALLLDSYESLRFLDEWLREDVLPRMGVNLRVFLFSREPPARNWLFSSVWQAGFESLPLQPLSHASAVDLLLKAGYSQAEAQRINRFAHGHPMALQLSLTASPARRGLHLEGEALPKVLETLARYYLDEIEDPLTRRALLVAASLRRVTVSILRAVLPDAIAADAYARLEALPLISFTSDGLQLHDTVREALAAHWRAADPAAYRTLRQRAWRQLRAEAGGLGAQDLWRYTADMLYMLENLHVRDAFFPADTPFFLVQRSHPEDREAIFDIIRRYESPEAQKVMASWWERLPDSFYVVRDEQGSIAGFHQAFCPDSLPRAWLQDDPMTRHWQKHLVEHPVSSRETVLFARRWLTADHGEQPCAAQAACWLDMKRFYMQMRTHLRRVYIAGGQESAVYADVTRTLGFVPSGAVEIGQTYHWSVNDFGPESVDGWLAGLIAAELGIHDNRLLDRDAREAIVDGARVPLTRLEYAVLSYLDERRGRPVTRASLLNDVWGYTYEGGSNVVDAVVRTLRKKLGSQAAAIETVTGVGYRLRAG